MKKLQKPDDATFCNLFERKMTYFFAFVGRLQMYEKLLCFAKRNHRLHKPFVEIAQKNSFNLVNLFS